MYKNYYYNRHAGRELSLYTSRVLGPKAHLKQR